MRIIIEETTGKTIDVLKAIVKHFDGYCLPGLLKPKKYILTDSGELKKDVNGNISLLFC